MRDYLSLAGLQAFVGHGSEPHDGTVVVGSLEEERHRGLTNTLPWLCTDLLGIPDPEGEVVECNEASNTHRL